jgi:hypothetical protein
MEHYATRAEPLMRDSMLGLSSVASKREIRSPGCSDVPGGQRYDGVHKESNNDAGNMD